MLRAALALIVIASAATAAHAECATRAWIGGVAGRPATIPNRGTVYFAFDPYDDRGIDLAVEPHDRVRVTRVSRWVARIDYTLEPGDVLDIKHHDWPLAKATAVTMTPPPAENPRVLGYVHREFKWTCSSQDAFVFTLDQSVAAVRARWQSGLVTSEWIVVPAGKQFELGALNCSGTNIPPAELHAGGFLRLTAIRHDGSEVPIEQTPWFLKADGLPVADRPDDDELVAQETSPEPSSSPAPIAWLTMLAGATLTALSIRSLRQPKLLEPPIL